MAGVVWKRILMLPSFAFPVCLLFTSLHKIIHIHIYRVIQHHHMTSVLLSFCVIFWKKDDTNSFVLHILFLIFALLCFCWLLCPWRFCLSCLWAGGLAVRKGKRLAARVLFLSMCALPYALRRLLTIPNNARDEARSLSLSPSTCRLPHLAPPLAVGNSLPACPPHELHSGLALQEYLPHASAGWRGSVKRHQKSWKTWYSGSQLEQLAGVFTKLPSGQLACKTKPGRFPARQAGKRAYGQTDALKHAGRHSQHPARCPLTIPRHAPRCDQFTNSGPESHQIN